MATSGKSKAGQQPVLAANVTRIVAELHQLAATCTGSPAADHRTSSDSAMVIRGK